jgi:hypothetical protein
MMRYRCKSMQQIISKSLLSFKSVAPPGPFAELGCIIIGRARQVLGSPKSSLEPLIFGLPNVPMLPGPSGNFPQSSGDSEEDESACSSRLEITFSTSIEQDASQAEEGISFSTSFLAIGLQLPPTRRLTIRRGSVQQPQAS